MRVHRSFFHAGRGAVVACLAVVAACAADNPAEKKPPVPCTIQGDDCVGPAKDLRQAWAAYWKGVKLRPKDLAGAYAEFSEAARLVPGNLDYASAREVARIELAQQHIDAGNRLLLDGRQPEAVAEFRTALELDAGNSFTQQRLMDALGDAAPRLSPGLSLAARSDPIDLQPRPGPADLHYRGDSRGLYEMIARTFGVKASFDQSFAAQPVRFDVEEVNFAKAMELAGMVSKTFWVPLSESEFLVAADNAEVRRQLEHMSLRSFYVSAASPQELNDIVGTLRGVFDIKLVSPNPGKNLITVRAPRATLEAATQFLEQLSQGGPQQVMLDIQAFEIDRMVLSNLGAQLPLQYNIINLSQIATLLAATPNIQQLINQLIASGGINQANSTALTALLAQLQSSSVSSLLSTPFATFGGGITLTGVTIPPATGNFSFNSSNIRSLDHMTLRAMQGKSASLMLGTRYPILNASFAPIYNTPAIAQSVQNNTYIAPFPSVSYEDLGLTVKTTATVHGAADVTLDLETQLRALTGQVVNSVPVISQRSYKSTITVKNGETAVVVGYINKTEELSLAGLPGLGAIPDVGLAVADQNKTGEDDEFMIVITPHILELPAAASQAVWVPASK